MGSAINVLAIVHGARSRFPLPLCHSTRGVHLSVVPICAQGLRTTLMHAWVRSALFLHTLFRRTGSSCTLRLRHKTKIVHFDVGPSWGPDFANNTDVHIGGLHCFCSLLACDIGVVSVAM